MADGLFAPNLAHHHAIADRTQGQHGHQRGAQTRGVGDIARTGLEAGWGRLIDGFLKGDIRDHIATALPGWSAI